MHAYTRAHTCTRTGEKFAAPCAHPKMHTALCRASGGRFGALKVSASGSYPPPAICAPRTARWPSLHLANRVRASSIFWSGSGPSYGSGPGVRSGEQCRNCTVITVQVANLCESVAQKSAFSRPAHSEEKLDENATFGRDQLLLLAKRSTYKVLLLLAKGSARIVVPSRFNLLENHSVAPPDYLKIIFILQQDLVPQGEDLRRSVVCTAHTYTMCG